MNSIFRNTLGLAIVALLGALTPACAADTAAPEDIGTDPPQEDDKDGTGTTAEALGTADANRDWAAADSCTTGCAGLRSGVKFALKNQYNGSYVAYGERTWGINLVWYDAKKIEVQFVKQGGGAINYGDRVALRFDTGGYVGYQSRDWGINLGWKSSAAYEWEITGGTAGQPLRYNDRFGLLNKTNNDRVVYCVRGTGINLKWATDCTRDATPNGPTTTSITMSRQPILQGNVPYMGTFGPITTGAVISKINFPTQWPAVKLVKPGYSTNDCGNANAVVVVQGDMTAAQKTAIWGTSNITLNGTGRLNFVGCSTSSTLLEWLPVNITWSHP